MTVPIAIASVSAHAIHMAASRQSRGPDRVAFTAPRPLNSALITEPLNRNLRTSHPSSTPTTLPCEAGARAPAN